jgi:hypothetical protein
MLPWMLAGWPDAAFEHEVELLRLAHFVACIGVSYVVLAADVTQLFAGVVIQLSTQKF